LQSLLCPIYRSEAVEDGSHKLFLLNIVSYFRTLTEMLIDLHVEVTRGTVRLVTKGDAAEAFWQPWHHHRHGSSCSVSRSSLRRATKRRLNSTLEGIFYKLLRSALGGRKYSDPRSGRFFRGERLLGTPWLKPGFPRVAVP
jgi:hypothetical protein